MIESKGKLKLGDHYHYNDKAGVEMPGDILDLIYATYVKRSALRDIIRTSLVCKRWLSIAISDTPSGSDQPPLYMLTPVSLLDSQGKKQCMRFLSFWGKEDSSSNRQVYDIDATNIMMSCNEDNTTTRVCLRRPCCFRISSAGGWLVISCECRTTIRGNIDPFSGSDHLLALYNPFSKVYVELLSYATPPTPSCCPTFMERQRFVHPKEPNRCLVFSSRAYMCDFVVFGSLGSHLSLSRLDNRRGDSRRHSHTNQWSYHHNQRHSDYIQLLFRKETQHLYALDKSGEVDVFSVQLEEYSSRPRLNLVFSKSTILGKADYYQTNKKLVVHLVESCGELLIVAEVEIGWTRFSFDVYKVREEDMSVEQIHSLGDRALFVEYTGGSLGSSPSPSFSASAKDFPKVEPNCIYLFSFLHVTVYSLHHKSTIRSAAIRELTGNIDPDRDYIQHTVRVLIAPPPLKSPFSTPRNTSTLAS